MKPYTINAVVEQRRIEDLEYLLILQDGTHPVHESLRDFILDNIGRRRMLIYSVPRNGDQQYLVGLGDTDEARQQDQTKILNAFKRAGNFIEAT
jgi:hypothetical protein